MSLHSDEFPLRVLVACRDVVLSPEVGFDSIELAAAHYLAMRKKFAEDLSATVYVTLYHKGQAREFGHRSIRTTARFKKAFLEAQIALSVWEGRMNIAQALRGR